MVAKFIDIRREFQDYTFYSWFIYRLFPPLLGTLLSLLPAFFYGCDSTAGLTPSFQSTYETKVSLFAAEEEIRTLDVFVFRDDIFRRLDCYQRFSDMEQWEGSVISGNGDRIITAVANCPYSRDDWASLTSRSGLEKIPIMLEDEIRGAPMMSGEIHVSTGEDSAEKFMLRPYASEVILNSISCNFQGKAYAGEKITDARVYLTNVNAECMVIGNDDASPRRIINSGRLNEDDLKKFNDRSLITDTIGDEIGTEAVFPDIRLWCYCNNGNREGPGTPYTRLVIEGRISGQTYYWPIDINRGTDTDTGVWRNRRYIYDVTIRCKGSHDPDTPVKSGDMIITQKTREWEEKEEYEVSF